MALSFKMDKAEKRDVEMRRLEAGEMEPLLGMRIIEEELEIIEGEVEEIFDPMSLVGVILPLFALGLLVVGIMIAEPLPPS